MKSKHMGRASFVMMPYLTLLTYLTLPFTLPYLRTYLITQTSTPKPSPPKLAKSKPDNFMGRTYPHTYPHISPTPQMGPMALQGALGGSPGRPPRWTQNRPPYGGICAGTSGICACKQIYMFTRGRGGYVRRFGGMCGRPAGYVRRGAPCVRGFGDMCGICACGKKRGVREICPGMCGSPWLCAGTSIPHKAAQTDGHPGTRALKTCFDIISKHMGQASFVMIVMGTRSKASFVSHRTYPRTYPKTLQPASNPSKWAKPLS